MTLKVNVAVLCQDIFNAAPPHLEKTFAVPAVIDGKIVYGESQS
jgi:hypothetical protein